MFICSFVVSYKYIYITSTDCGHYHYYYTALLAVKPKIASIDGVKSVQRVVCGGCLDFKVVIALPIEKFKAWVSC